MLLAGALSVVPTHHGNGAAKVQNPVLHSEVEPEVQMEGCGAGSLFSTRGTMPGKGQSVSDSPRKNRQSVLGKGCTGHFVVLSLWLEFGSHALRKEMAQNVLREWGEAKA